MKERFLNNCISFVKSNNIEIQEEELRYGLEGIYLTFGKFLIIFPLAFLLGIFKEFILTLIFFNIIRYPAFGIHANKSSTCLFSSILILVGIPLLMSNSNMYNYIYLFYTICSSWYNKKTFNQ